MTAFALLKPQIEFREEDHRYFVDGREVRAWSTIAKEMGLVVIPDHPNVINAKHRGKQIHQAASFLIRGWAFDVQDLQEESLPYVQAFVDFWRRYRLDGAEAETPLYCPDLDYCTTPDFHTDVSVNDIKTSDRPSLSWGIQTAAQALALGNGEAHRRIIWLRPKLKTRSYEILEPGDTRVFSEFDFDVVREASAGIEGPAIKAWKSLR